MVGYKDYNIHKHLRKPLTESKTDNHDLLTLRMVSSQTVFFWVKVWSTTYSIFIQVHRNAGTLFFSNLTLDIIEYCIPYCMPTIY